MRGLLLLLAILVAPVASAGIDACGGDAACADAWSAKDGSCGGAGSERNVVNATSALPYAGESSLFVETFCVRTGPTAYSEVRMDAAALGERAYLGWTNDGGTCRFFVVTEGAWLGSYASHEPCHGATPPMVPALV